MKRITVLLVAVVTAGLAACSDDDGVVDPPLPEIPSALTALQLSGYRFDTDTLNIPSVGEKFPDDPVTIPLDFSVRAEPAEGALIERVRITITPQSGNTPVVDTVVTQRQGDVFRGTLAMNIARNEADDYDVRAEATDSRGVAATPALSKVVVLNSAYPPVMSDLTAPDSLKRPASDDIAFLFTVRVTDQSGPEDIWRVFYSVRRPDGTSSGNLFPLNDDGRNGDAVAGDNIYTAGAKISSTNDLGVYTFEFQAIDRSNKAAPPIIHEIIVY